MSDEQFEGIMEQLRQLNDKLSRVTTITYETTSNDCDHEYPSVWHAIVPPLCLKCGKPATQYNINY